MNDIIHLRLLAGTLTTVAFVPQVAGACFSRFHAARNMLSCTDAIPHR